MSSEDIWLSSANWIVPMERRTILGGKVQCKGGEELRFNVRIITDETLEPIAIIVKPLTPYLPIDPNLRYIFHNKPIKIQARIEIKEF